MIKSNSKMLRLTQSEHNGAGGLYFVTTSIICSLIMVISLNLSWTSQVVAMADNIAYIASINATVHNYMRNANPYQEYNPSIPTASGGSYDPLADFNQMARDAGIAATNATAAYIEWTGEGTYLQIGSFKTILGSTVTPHRQESVIENY